MFHYIERLSSSICRRLFFDKKPALSFLRLGWRHELADRIDNGLDLTWTARLLLRTLDSMPTPCSVKTYGRYRRPPLPALLIFHFGISKHWSLCPRTDKINFAIDGERTSDFFVICRRSLRELAAERQNNKRGKDVIVGRRKDVDVVRERMKAKG
jgi:hypothetical protein